ncbi:hypothetical protein BJX65DRAFT_263561 [Aspergillus insuetus]
MNRSIATVRVTTFWRKTVTIMSFWMMILSMTRLMGTELHVSLLTSLLILLPETLHHHVCCLRRL